MMKITNIKKINNGLNSYAIRGDLVLVAKCKLNGQFTGLVYEFLETEEDGFLLDEWISDVDLYCELEELDFNAGNYDDVFDSTNKKKALILKKE